MKAAALQQAVYNVLSGDATLTAALSAAWTDSLGGIAPIFSDVPQENADDNSFYPFISFAPASHLPWDDKDTLGGEAVWMVNAWTRSGDFYEGDTIAERVKTLLHRQSLTIAGATHILTQFEGLDPTLDPDGETRRHMLTFRVIYQA